MSFKSNLLKFECHDISKRSCRVRILDSNYIANDVISVANAKPAEGKEMIFPYSAQQLEKAYKHCLNGVPAIDAFSFLKQDCRVFLFLGIYPEEFKAFLQSKSGA